ncbi:MAG: AmmeMemoRadiSam system protein B [bacterium]
MIRKAAVAGAFYPASAEECRQLLSRFVSTSQKKEKAMGILVPHAGYEFSGSVAGEVYGRVELPHTVVILGPNHRGYGKRAAVFASGSWETPLGEVPIDVEFSTALLGRSSLLEADETAHIAEHSLEVQVPFLQYLSRDVAIVPICLQLTRYDECAKIGHEIAETIRASGRDALIVASSDMSHEEPRGKYRGPELNEFVRSQDDKAIREILRLDPDGLYRTVRDNGISMCGVIPAAIMLVSSKELGAKRATLVATKTSAESEVARRFDRYSYIVGYAGVIVQ